VAAKTESVQLNRVLPRIETSAGEGLTPAQARERLENGYANVGPDSAGKTVLQVIKGHVCTYFNLVFMLLGLITLFWGSIGNIFFINVVIINTVIGVIQELRSRAALAKLTFMSMPQATAIRGGQQISLSAEDTVLDDVVIFSSGQQIYADAIVLAGECQVNEALVTGEADEITKTPGEQLLSGSFIVSGECAARLDKVGADSFVAKLTLDAKKTRSKLSSGSMVSALKRLVQVIGIIIVPVGITMFIMQMHGGFDAIKVVDSTVAALVGMIPDGLYLLVSITLTVSVLRLARKRTLVQEMGCVETLARVNVLCVDKTGTITENAMEVKEIALLCEERFNADDIGRIIADYVGNLPAENETMAAIQSYIKAPATRQAVKTMPFSSAVKYGGVSFSSNESYLLGAPERILHDRYYKYQSIIEAHSARGYRVLLLAMYDKNINEALDPNRLMPLALILISNKVRENAPPTFEFFAKQGVRIIVISGDNPMTVSQIAREAGIEGAERYIDAAELTTERKLRRAVEDYIVFGRVTPDQKRKLVRALKKAGNTVAMTGDGVNDVLALKDANCSIAMKSGSEVACQVADIVLLDSDFSAMPAVVMEGRRVINNLQRSASLFVMKNIFSFLFACTITIPFLSLFPMEGLQFTLYNSMIIGIPSFILAMEPNYSIVSGKFLINVFRSALPAGLTSFIALTSVFLLFRQLTEPTAQEIVEMQTMSVLAITFVGFLMLVRICQPFTKLRIVLLIGVLIGFMVGFLLFSGTINFMPEEFVKLTLLSGSNILWLVVVCVVVTPVFFFLTYVTRVKPRSEVRL